MALHSSLIELEFSALKVSGNTAASAKAESSLDEILVGSVRGGRPCKISRRYCGIRRLTRGKNGKTNSNRGKNVR
jgi:hypothetical protein